jgi:hypothetical protein
MSDEIDREIREVSTKKVTPLPNNSVNGSRISEQRTTQVRSDNTSNGVIIGVVIVLALGAGAIAYYLNNRPLPTAPIVLPRATDTVKENKTIIERSTTKEVSPAPATVQSAPKIEVTLPPAVTITQPPAPAPAPTTTIMIQPEPVAPVAPPKATAQPQTPAPSPTPSAVK